MLTSTEVKKEEAWSFVKQEPKQGAKPRPGRQLVRGPGQLVAQEALTKQGGVLINTLPEGKDGLRDLLVPLASKNILRRGY